MLLNYRKGETVISLKKIAQMTGVSPSTVSRVLNDRCYNCATEQLKDQIWQAAETLHYLPNSAARALQSGSSIKERRFHTAICLSRIASLDTDPFFKEVFRSVELELFSRECMLTDIINLESLLQMPVPKSPDNQGVIILGRCSREIISLLRKHFRYLVNIGRNSNDFEIDEIICDGMKAAGAAVEYLLSLGHRKIAYIGDCTSESRYVGYCETLFQHKIPLNYQYVFPTGQTEKEGYAVMSRILHLPDRPTAFLCANDVTAIGVLDACKQIGAKDYPPSVISIDNIAASQRTEPLLTTIHIPKEDMGRLAVMILMNRMQGRHAQPARIELPFQLIVRDSCFVCK